MDIEMGNSMSFATIEELGNIARAERNFQGLSLRKMASRAGVGVRFLSEFERGKPTAEVGKVLAVFNAIDMGLTIITGNSTNRSEASDRESGLSELLDTEYPYDWSNSKMSEGLFIRKALKAQRFNDILKVVGYFGFNRVADELPYLDETIINKVISLLTRIQKGFLLSKCQKPDAV